tara:strand:- start:14 stop:352 length:339 start_codon:yes stop_codon:yes gene_type:complete
MERLILLALNIFIIVCIPIAILAILVFVEMNLDLITKIIIGLVVFTLFFGLFFAFVPEKWQVRIGTAIKEWGKILLIIWVFAGLIIGIWTGKLFEDQCDDEYCYYLKEQNDL